MTPRRGILSSSATSPASGPLTAADVDAALTAIVRQSREWVPCRHLLHPDARPGSHVLCAALCGAVVEVPADWAERTARLRAAIADAPDDASARGGP